MTEAEINLESIKQDIMNLADVGYRRGISYAMHEMYPLICQLDSRASKKDLFREAILRYDRIAEIAREKRFAEERGDKP